MNRKGVSLLLCFLLLFSVLPGSLADEYSLELDLKGQVYQSAEEWQAKEIFGTFDVYMDEAVGAGTDYNDVKNLTFACQFKMSGLL